MNYDWTGPSSGGDWKTANNWTPVPDLPTVTPPQITWIADWRSSNRTNLDTVSIDGASVTTGGYALEFYLVPGANPLSGQEGTHTSLTLSNNASLTAGNFRVSSSRSSGIDYIRNMDIQSGSSLNVNLLTTGSSNWTPATSSTTWSIGGSVQAANFNGLLGNFFPAQASGGYFINLDGGSLTVAGTFNWDSNGIDEENLANGRINLSNGGTISAGTMTANWSESANTYIDFLDGTGSVTFGKTNFDTIVDVQALIDNGQIRLNGAISPTEFQINDGGSVWEITSTIPEPSNVAFAFGALVALSITFRRRQAHH